MSVDTQDLVVRAKKILSAVMRRAHGDPEKDPFACKWQQLERRRKAGLPLSDPDIAAEALKVHADLSTARKKANEAVLGDE